METCFNILHLGGKKKKYSLSSLMSNSAKTQHREFTNRSRQIKKKKEKEKKKQAD